MKKFLKKSRRSSIKPKNRHILILMTMFCLALMAATFSTGIATTPVRNAAGLLVVPFEKTINYAGTALDNLWKTFQEKEILMAENEELTRKVDALTTENNFLLQSQTEVTELKALYDLDKEYEDYPKVAASVIGKDPGNWYSKFTIDKGSKDGVQVGNNVLAGNGLAGIVIETGPNWALVESIINDTSNVSAKTVTTESNCIVEGDLELIDSGLLRFTDLYDEEDKVTVGERIVTSHISEKYLEGLFIGYVGSVEKDSNNLTKTGTIVTPVDFEHLKYVMVITEIKSVK